MKERVLWDSLAEWLSGVLGIPVWLAQGVIVALVVACLTGIRYAIYAPWWFARWKHNREGRQLLHSATKYRAQEELDDAQRDGERALQSFEKGKSGQGQAETLRGLGETADKQGNKELAKQHFYQAAKLYQQQGMDHQRDQANRQARAL